jgi:hypothetical protein
MNSTLNRRRFLQTSAAGATAASVLSSGLPLAAKEQKESALGGKADSCIFIWLGGGSAQIDTWDPKRKSTGKKDPGCYYDSIDTAVKGIQVTEHLPRSAKLMERIALLRTVNHDVIDEHAAATNRMHTGRPPTGTVLYPSVGSIVAHELGARGEGIPPYVLMGYPNVTRGPGFLGAKAGCIYLTDTESGPSGLKRPHDVTETRQSRREKLLSIMRSGFAEKTQAEAKVADYIAASEQGFKLAGPDFMNVFDLKNEDPALRAAYGNEFGQRCLLARRLVEAGVSFCEVSFNLNFVNGTGWDTHNKGQLNQHLIIDQLDQGFSTLISDLEKRGRLEKTLIVIASEFGRPPEFDGGGGRGHQGSAFTVVMAGGGLKTGQAVGTTDHLSKTIADRPISVPDMHATIHTALGIDPHQELYAGERPVPITDRGEAVKELFV